MLIAMFCAGLLDLILAIIVWKKDKKKLLNRIFTMMAIFIAIWIFLNFFFQLTYDLSIVIHFYSVGALLASSMTLFIWCFVEEKLPRKVLLLTMLPGVIFSILSYIDGLIIASVDEAYFTGYNAKPGILFFAYGAFIIINIVFCLYKFFSKYKRFNADKKLQAKYIICGLAGFSIFTSVVSFILPFFKIWSYTSFDTLSSLFFTVSITYAITKHHFMNIKLVATEIFLVLIDVTLLIDALMAKTGAEIILKLFIFAFMVFFSILLMRSIFKELKTTEKLEKTAEELKTANEALLELDKTKSEFMSIASHQLLTPLTPIRGYSSMLLEGEYGQVTDKQKRVLEMIYASSVRLVDLASNLLDISRIERGVVEYKFEPANICKIIEGVVEEMKQRAEGTGLKIICKLPKGSAFKFDCLVNIDKDKIREVLINLIDNAIKYSSTSASAKSKKQIEIKAEMDSDEILVSVKDYGIGISKEDIPKLFKKFSRADEVKTINVEGTGLGLYVAKQYIDAHKGRIWVESAGKGKGATFYFAVGVGK